MRRYFYIIVMGFVGAILRYGLELLAQGASFPYATLAVNVFGCFFIELVYGYFGRRSTLPDALISGMGVGLVGAFTTMSTFSAENVRMLLSGNYLLFGVYSLTTILTCLAAVLLGVVINDYLALDRQGRLERRRAVLEEQQRGYHDHGEGRH